VAKPLSACSVSKVTYIRKSWGWGNSGVWPPNCSLGGCLPKLTTMVIFLPLPLPSAPSPLPSAPSPLPSLINMKMYFWCSNYELFYSILLILVLHLNSGSPFSTVSCVPPQTPGTHLRALRCGGGRPRRGSPRSSAAHSESRDVLTLPWIARFSARFASFPGHLILSGWLRYPSSASYRLPGSRKLRKTLIFFGCWYTYRQGMAPGSTPGSPRRCWHPARTAGQTSPRTCGNQIVPLRCDSLLGKTKFRAIDCHRAVVEHVVRTQPALEDNLRMWGEGRVGVRTGYWKKEKDICIECWNTDILNWNLAVAACVMVAIDGGIMQLNDPNFLAQYHFRTGPHGVS